MIDICLHIVPTVALKSNITHLIRVFVSCFLFTWFSSYASGPVGGRII